MPSHLPATSNRTWARNIIHGTYYPHLDGLRALAILPVVLFHLCNKWCPGGFMGVDVFFVLSGYLITKGILSNLAEGVFSPGHFFVKRIRRILPAYMAMILLVLLAGCVLFYSGPLRYLGGAALMSALYMANIFFCLSSSGYFSSLANESPLQNLWSLSVEEQFYLFIPFLAWFAWHFFRKRIQLLFWLLCLTSFAGACHLTMDGEAHKAFYYLPWRAWELLCGSLLAFNLQGKGMPCTTGSRWKQPASIAGLILILYPYIFYNSGSWLFPGPGALPSIAGTLILISTGQYGGIGRLLSMPPLVFIGKISYSLYLYHWPVMVFWKYCLYEDFLISPTLSAADYAGMTLLSLLLGFLSWKYIEIPGRLYQWTRGKAFRFAVFSMAFTGLLGLSAIISDGFRDIIHKEANLAASSSSQYRNVFEPFLERMSSTLRGFETNAYSPLSRIGPDNTRPRFLLIGDSHAGHLRHGIHHYCQEHGMGGYVYTLPSNKIYNTFREENLPDFDKAIALLSQLPTIDTIILSNYWDDPAIALDLGKLELFCRFFISMGKRVIVLTDNPDWESTVWNYYHGPSDLYAKSRIIPLPVQGEEPWRMSKSTYHARSRQVEILKELGQKKVARVIPMHEAFLRYGYYVSRDPETGHAYYMDSNHLEHAGSMRAVYFAFPLIFQD